MSDGDNRTADCVHHRFLERAAEQPGAPAVVCGGASLSYGALAERARDLAAALRARGAKPGALVGVAVGRGVEMVTALMGVLLSGAAYVPIDPDYPADRVGFMLEDADVAVLITQSGVAPGLPPHGRPVLLLDGDWGERQPVGPDAGPGDLIYAMYTSGSTGRPKCAGNTHAGIANLVDAMADRPGLSASDTVATLISLSHDMSVADIFLALSVGARLQVITGPEAADPGRLGVALAAGPTSYLSATPSTFRMLLDQGWRPAAPMTVLMAGEALPPDIVAPLVERGCAVWNGYGMTEASVYTTITRCLPERPVTIGGRVANTPVYLLDEELRPVAAGEVGELFHGGVGTGTGYLGRPTLTAERFLADPFRPGGVMYRSGDLARETPEGGLIYLGRADRQVKIRGYRVELAEVEDRLNAHPGVAAAVADATPDPAGGRRLVAWIVPTAESVDPARLHADVRARLAEALPAWMVPGRFVDLDALPLTPMGKIDRRALPEPGADRGAVGAYVAPAGGDEAVIAGLFGRVLAIDGVGATDDFFALGGHSILAARLAFAIHEALGVDLPSRAVFEATTPRALAAALNEAGGRGERIPRRGPGPVPLTDTQRRLWFIHQLDPASVEYNVSVVLHLDGPLDRVALQRALDALFQRQAALRTVYRAVDGRPTQSLAPARVRLAVTALDHLEPEDRDAEAAEAARAFFRRPFDLASGPPARVSLQALGPERHRLLICVHHVAIDGWSIGVVARDLAALYREQAPPALAIDALDYAAWRAATLDEARIQELLGWWRQALGDAADSAPAALPSDRPGERGGAPSLEGALQSVALPAALSAGVRGLARRSGATVFEVLLAAFGALLRGELGREAVSVGTVVAAREQPELDGLVGFFANTLVIPLRADAGAPFAALIDGARAAARAAFAHQDMPFDRLVAALRPERTAAQQPLVRACFILQPSPPPPLDVGGLTVTVEEVDNGTAPFDLTLNLWDDGSAIHGNLLYRTERFLPETAAALTAGLQALLETAVEAPEAPVVGAWVTGDQRVEGSLLGAAGVRDAAVYCADGPGGETVRVAAVVGRGEPAALRALAPSLGRVERVSHIPLDGDGRPDRAALAAAAPWTPRASPVHLEDVLPASLLSGGSGAASGGAGPAAETADDGPALLEGGPLAVGDRDPRTLGDALRRAAREAPTQGIVDVGPDGVERFQSYPALLAAAERIAGGLQARRLAPGSHVILQVAENRSLLPVLWGCFLGGYVVLNMAVPNAYDRSVAAAAKLEGVWRSLDRPVVLADAERVAGLAAFAELRAWPVGDLDGDFQPPTLGGDDQAMLLLTSGSTGVPKSVQHTHDESVSFLASYCGFLGLGPDDVFLNWLGLDHVAPLFMCHLSGVWSRARGVNATLAAFLGRPRSALDWIHAHRATTTFLPNFAYGLINEAAAEPGDWDLSCFRAATNGGEMIVARTARRFLSRLAPYGLPGSAMVPIWGMSETCSATLIDPAFRLETSSDDDAFVPCGVAVAGFDARIVDSEGQTLRRGEVGRLLVRGATVTRGYLRRPDANAEAFVGDGWFDTGDLAFIGERGVTLTGRLKDVIIVAGVNYYSHEIEAAAESVEGVERSYVAAIAARRPGDQTDRVAVFFSAPGWRDRPGLLRAIRAAVTRSVGITPEWLMPVSRADIPKTEIGKIQRTKLRARFEAGEFDALRRELELSMGSDVTLPGWFHRRRWVPRRAVRAAGELGRPLVFCRGPASLAVAEALGAVAVRLGPDDSAEDYVAVLRSVGGPAPVVHLWGLDEGGLDSAHGLLRLVQAAATVWGLDARWTLLTCAAGAQDVSGEGAEPWRALASGLAVTAPHELPGLRARHVDLAPDALASAEAAGDLAEVAADVAAALLDELADSRDEPEVALRAGRRLVPRLEAASLASGAPPMAPGEPLLITGARGGIGQLLVADLLERGFGPLLLVGRSPEGAPPPPGVRYARLELAEEGALAAAVVEAEAAWGRPLAGVFHLAGAMPTVTLREERPAGLRAVLDAKLDGALAVHALAREREDCFVVEFSSVNAVFGGFSVGAYAAGCRFGAAAAAAARAEGRRAWTLTWSRWDDVGITRGRPGGALAERRGYLAVPPAQGLRSLWACLAQPPGEWIIGLDADSPAVRERAVGAVERVVGASRPEPAAAAGAGARPGGALDEVEQRVAAIWAEALGASRVGATDNFFDLGGHSLMLIQVQGRLEAAFERQLAVTDLFQHPTVETLAGFLKGDGRPGAASGGRARALRQRAARRRRRPGPRDD